MSNQQAPVGSADPQQNFLAGWVSLFLFDLKHEASEHGFKPDESWQLQIASEDEIISLKKLYHPVISQRLGAQTLLTAYLQIKIKLQQTFSKNDMALTADDLSRDGKQHLAAYPARSFRS